MPLETVVIGAGERGCVYAQYALDYPSLFSVVAVCEPRVLRRQKFAAIHQIPSNNIFLTWKDLLNIDRLCPCALICTQDAEHAEVAIALARKGYHLLVEKPMGVTSEECEAMVAECQKNGVIMAVAHVLRYLPYNKAVEDILRSGRIGEVVSIHHTEPVGIYHYVHSYVRGNWRSSKLSPMLLAKSCHDLDLLCHWMALPNTNSVPISVASFGSQCHFTAANKPVEAGNATRCVECSYERNCCWSAKKYYIDSNLLVGNVAWPVSVIVESGDIPDIENVNVALKETNYGKCVYGACGNDQVESQVCILNFSGGRTVSFSMVAYTKLQCVRQTRVEGTLGCIVGDGEKIELLLFQSGETETIAFESPSFLSSYWKKCHHGADWFTIASFVSAVTHLDHSLVLTSGAESLRSHSVVFAAEQARLTNQIIQLENYKIKTPNK